ncbi:ADP-ribosylation factor-like protein 11 [Lepisosteus oculatus]|uniref:ADP-ribosylation factor-like protein 11 n=1 Tax=Lepisosteus oculatus TaxID=7918 RepID=W5NMP5_LEPOC|nr:PREDICTED: ADP-ribosylation factor-like protein 11 [Lepisosteus oculatus]
MGSAISKRYQTKPASVLLLGLDSSGKSTLLYKLKDDLAVETSPTIGFNVEMLELAHKTTLTIWDVGGQDSMRPNWKHYLEDCDALVFVVDSADSSRLDQAKAVLRKIMKDDNMKGVPLLVLANKKELPQSLSIREISNKLELSSYEDTDWEIQACSAYTGLGLQQALLSLAKRIKER